MLKKIEKRMRYNKNRSSYSHEIRRFIKLSIQLKEYIYSELKKTDVRIFECAYDGRDVYNIIIFNVVHICFYN